MIDEYTLRRAWAATSTCDRIKTIGREGIALGWHVVHLLLKMPNDMNGSSKDGVDNFSWGRGINVDASSKSGRDGVKNSGKNEDYDIDSTWGGGRETSMNGSNDRGWAEYNCIQ